MNFIKSVFVVAFLTFALVSCSDDDDSSPNNYVTGKDIDFTIKSGFLFYYGEYNKTNTQEKYEGSKYELTLFDLDNDVLEDNFEEDYNGAYQGIYFELFSSNSTGVEPGEYRMDLTTPFSVNTFIASSYFLVLNDDQDEEQEKELDIVDGKLIVEKNKDTYTLTFTLTDENGDKVEGHYKGELTFVKDDYDINGRLSARKK